MIPTESSGGPRIAKHSTKAEPLGSFFPDINSEFNLLNANLLLSVIGCQFILV
jgi:hypothetical protein